MEEHGARVVAFCFRRIDQRLSERLYRDGLVMDVPGRHIRSWWIKSKVFELGESLVLLLRHPEDQRFQATITDSKGASDPLLARPGTYRETYRTPNKTFGLLHSSDDWLSMLYETSVLFEPTDLAELLVQEIWSPAVRVAVTSYEAGLPLHRIEQYRVLYRLKRRLLAELLTTGAVPSSVLKDLEERYAAAARVVDENPGHVPETAKIELLLAEEREFLVQLPLPDQPAGAVEVPAASTALVCLRLLADPDACQQMRFEDFQAALAALGILPSTLELTALESLFFFRPSQLPSDAQTRAEQAVRSDMSDVSPAYRQILDAAEELDDYPLTVENVREMGEAGLQGAADHIAFMIITPDAVHRGRHVEILEAIRDAGFVVLAHRAKYLRDNDIEELYKDGLRKKVLDHRTTHWYLTRKGLGMGASLGLLLHHPEAGACSRLLALKGVSHPAQAAPESLRGALRSYSKILALLHSSDGPTAVLRESLLYFTPTQLHSMLEQLAEDNRPEGIPVSIMTEILSPTTPDDDPVTVLYALKARVVHTLLAHPITPAELRPALYAQLDTIRAARTSVCRGKTPWTLRLVAAATELEREHKLLNGSLLAQSITVPMSAAEAGEALEWLVWTRLALTIRQLADHDRFPSLDADQLIQALRAGHVHLTSWEALLLENLLFFWEP
ncbi:nucleoside-diphosphate kinase [Streptomyces sp. NBC_00878]|uniref:nucleoside-diphosphate kinase n=1 Tax=Streptomyces sp. NBC_00878 TaxID=2975854 RepID=UPI002258027C|nr:nucleoside-diphosphate kinase [Streptomyces sp. NBC_00878]MCX4911666.1 nucleoside-diphosphate kinase [Streptomyces sp. NBC_00878]